MNNNELISVQYDRLVNEKETLKAFLFIIDGKDVWLPKS